jgi:diguanylate cyclase (GGDEF)-like protein
VSALRLTRMLLTTFIAAASVVLVWAISQVEITQLDTLGLFVALALLLSHWHLKLEGGVLSPVSAPITAAGRLLLPTHLAVLMDTCVTLRVAWRLHQPPQKLLLNLANSILPTFLAGGLFTLSGYRTGPYSGAGMAAAVGVLFVRWLLNLIATSLCVAREKGCHPWDILHDLILAEGWAGPSMQLTGILTALAYQYAGASSLLVASATVFSTGQCTRLYAQRKRLTRLAHRDALTEVGNRHAWDERLGSLMQRPDAPYFLATFDLNGLKAANDAFGHAMGDRVLRSFAKYLAAAAGGEHVFRFGGDEFVVLLTQRTHQEMGDLQQLLLRVTESFEEEWSARGIRVSASMGYAHAIDTADIPAALYEADRAMYDQKRLTNQELDAR